MAQNITLEAAEQLLKSGLLEKECSRAALADVLRNCAQPVSAIRLGNILPASKHVMQRDSWDGISFLISSGVELPADILPRLDALDAPPQVKGLAIRKGAQYEPHPLSSALHEAIDAVDVKRVRQLVTDDPSVLLPRYGIIEKAKAANAATNPPGKLQIEQFLEKHSQKLDKFEKEFQKLTAGYQAPSTEAVKKLLDEYPNFIKCVFIDGLVNGIEEERQESDENLRLAIQAGGKFSPDFIPNMVECSMPLSTMELAFQHGAELPPEKEGRVEPSLYSASNVEIIKYLEGKGVRFDQRDRTGATPLFYAGMNPEMSSYWLSQGCKINDVDDQGRTVLWRNTPEPFSDRTILDPKIGLEWIKQGALYDLNDRAQNIPLIKAFAINGLNSPTTLEYPNNEAVAIFDKLQAEIADMGGKLAKRVPNPVTHYKDFIAFAEVLGKVHKLVQALDPKHHSAKSISPLFIDIMNNTSGGWQEVSKAIAQYTSADIEGYADAVRASMESFVLADFMRRTRNRAEHIDYEEAESTLTPEVAVKVVGNRGLPTLLALSRAWHSDRPQLDALREIPRKGRWEPLTEDYTAPNGYTVTFLTTSEELEKEGKTLDHCVGTYTSECVEKPIHIASIRKSGVPVSTVEFEEAPDRPHQVTVKQHYGRKNSVVFTSSPEVVALQSFLDQLLPQGDSGKPNIKIDFEHLARKRAGRAAVEDSIALKLGYDPYAPNAQENQQKLFNGYLNIRSEQAGTAHSFIPGGKSKWGERGLDKFLASPINPPDDNRTLNQVMDRLAEHPPRRSTGQRRIE